VSVPVSQVDAFAERAFAGNPAAVCVLAAPASASWMQAVAAEMNLSETAFLVRRAGGWDLRWFTPAAEVALCGHATLASAHTLWRDGHEPEGAEIRFHTASGVLGARRAGDMVELDFPAMPPVAAEPPAEVVAALGVRPAWSGVCGANRFVELATPEEVRAVIPDMARLSAATEQGAIVTAAGGEDGADVTSRYFAPAVGVPEDPVTGSAHCAIGPHWAARLGRARLRCHQASARGGVVHVEVRGDRVGLGGRAVTVMEGRLAVEPR
jgi:PhzF family phenazine biosynthesis protein